MGGKGYLGLAGDVFKANFSLRAYVMEVRVLKEEERKACLCEAVTWGQWDGREVGRRAHVLQKYYR